MVRFDSNLFRSVTERSFWCATIKAERIKACTSVESLQIEHLSKAYGTGENAVRAVDDVSFGVEKGEFLAIIGSFGSGRSTLLHILGGVERRRDRRFQRLRHRFHHHALCRQQAAPREYRRCIEA